MQFLTRLTFVYFTDQYARLRAHSATAAVGVPTFMFSRQHTHSRRHRLIF